MKYKVAYLLNKIENVNPGPVAERMLITGLHTVTLIPCARPHAVLVALPLTRS